MKKSAKRPKKRSAKNPNPVPKKLAMMIATDVERYLNVLGMNHYKATVFYVKKNTSEENHCCGEGQVAASATTNMRYLTIRVNIYPYMVDEWKKKRLHDEDIHEIIAHEVSHVATQHLYRLATSVYKDDGEMRDSWESLTTIIGRLVHEVYKSRV
ncbi:MAG: hypothetical protein AAB944_01475 [Patescibacteria group bacterium]